MKFSVCFIFLVTICFLPKTHLQGSKPVPGCSGCGYYASIEEYCQEPNVPVENLPKECTSYNYMDILADVTSKIDFGFTNISNDKYIKSLLGSGKPTFLYFGHQDVQEWIDVLQNCAPNAKTEMANLKKFLEPYQNISGLIIETITMEPGINNAAGFTDNFKAYINEMKSSFPKYSIGFEILGLPLSDYLSQPNPPEWLDFTVLDQFIDFYIINFFRFNKCTDEFKIGGVFPIKGNAQYTIEKVQGYIKKLSIPKEKTYWMFKVGPLTLNENQHTCEMTNAKVCASPSLDGFCAENIKSFYDKGVFAKQNGAGFIAQDVDLVDDPYGCCQCGSPYPVFHSMLAGFNSEPAPPACPLLDKC